MKYTNYNKKNFKKTIYTTTHLYQIYKINFKLTYHKPQYIIINKYKKSLYQQTYFITITIKIINTKIINFNS